MLKALYNAIREDTPASKLNINNRPYVTSGITPVKEPMPEPLYVRTLTGLVDYLKTNIDNLDIATLICHVESPEQVSLYSQLLDSFKQRPTFMCAQLKQIKIPFNNYLSGEEFNIILQSCFVDYLDDKLKATDRGLVLAYCSNIREVGEGITLDDGITQAVTVKKGLASVEKVVMPNPVLLRPFRTFTEVEQPASSFVFRAKEGPQFMLVEADGGAWKSEAMANIKRFLEEELPGLSVIA